MPRSTTLIQKLAEALQADATLAERVTHGVHEHRLPTPPHAHAWSRLCVRELHVSGGIRETPTGIVPVIVQLMAEVSDQHPAPDLLLESIQERAEEVLRGLTYDSDHGQTVLPVERYTRPSSASYDNSIKGYYSTSQFLIPIQ